MVAQARAGGVTGVPVTVVDGKWAISGGQSKDVYLQVGLIISFRGSTHEVYCQVFKKMAACCKSGTAKCAGGPVTNVETDPEATCTLQETHGNSTLQESHSHGTHCVGVAIPAA